MQKRVDPARAARAHAHRVQSDSAVRAPQQGLPSSRAAHHKVHSLQQRLIAKIRRNPLRNTCAGTAAGVIVAFMVLGLLIRRR